MSELELKNIVGFKAVDAEGNEQQVTVDEMAELVSARIVSAASEISTFAATAAAGTDEFEDQLPVSDTFSWLRTMDGSNNPTLTSSTAAAKVLGELMNNLKLYPFMVRKVINDDTDLNAVTKNGIYQLIGASGNNTPIRWGILLIFGYGGYLFQILSNVSTDIVVVKLRIGNEIGFSDWKTVSLT